MDRVGAGLRLARPALPRTKTPTMIHPIRRHRSGFTVIDLMAVGVVVVIVVVLIVVLLPTSGSNARMARQMANNTQPNNTQLRGIHQGFVTWAQSNKTGGNDGYFPGLDASGNVIPDGPLTGHSGNGTQPAARLWMMLEGNYFTPEYLLNPADTASIEAMGRDASGRYPPLTATNHSYALLHSDHRPVKPDHPARRTHLRVARNAQHLRHRDRRPGHRHRPQRLPQRLDQARLPRLARRRGQE